MNKLDLDYQNLVTDILNNGVLKEDRTETGTLSVFGRQIRHNMREGFPILTTKKMYFKGIVTELLWFLKGDTAIKYLIDNDCHIWDGDAYKNWILKSNDDSTRLSTINDFIYKLKNDVVFCEKWGNIGRVYGYQWRNWNNGVDQISNLINEVRKNPDSRRLLVTAWNPSDLSSQVLPPCHYGFQLYTRLLSVKEKVNWILKTHDVELQNGEITELIFEDSTPKRAISLMFNMRSTDVPLGLPFNITSYGILLEIIARMVNMIPDDLIANLGDAHVYRNQVDAIKEQLHRNPYPLPQLKISKSVNFNGSIDDMVNSCDKSSFTIDGYQSHAAIKIPLSN